MELWFTEKYSQTCGLTIKVKNEIYSERTKYQDIAFFDSYDFGRFFTLDGYMMVNEKDEFIYHEMITHVPLAVNPNIKKVLVLGGGDVVNSKDGYARNYLFPKNLAVEANEENLKKWEERKKEEAKKIQKEIEAANELKKKLESLTVTLKVKTGSQGRLFGSITALDIANNLKEQYGIDIDKRKIELKDNIKSLGEFEADVKLYQDITAKLKINVVSL
ncbi:50S ribosomal protein L9 [Vibrio parahaemolyticus]|nr:50S ribosomal protein L9 [Vibrio parahaemolyticus]